ncbi:hypothetical protein [Mesorhizobium sp. Root157]|nr:hypothetical protein [Mesorhizobium sp. Root157]
MLVVTQKALEGQFQTARLPNSETFETLLGNLPVDMSAMFFRRI